MVYFVYICRQIVKNKKIRADEAKMNVVGFTSSALINHIHNKGDCLLPKEN